MRRAGGPGRDHRLRSTASGDRPRAARRSPHHRFDYHARVPYASSGAALPRRTVLKWAGGKSGLLHEILPRLPPRIGTYHEPFLGGGAVFFALAAERRFERAVLSDKNPELIHLYTTLRDRTDELVAELERMEAEHSKERYYRVRDMPLARLGAVRRAARTVYLNRTGFNGLYRVNARGEFNVPLGSKTGRICHEEKLREAARLLAGVELSVQDFGRALRRVKRGDTVYLDPPYVPLSETAHFTAYQPDGFTEADQRRLATAFAALTRRGVHAVLSNSDTPLTRALYAQHELHAIRARRSINSNGAGRGPVPELLVVNRPA